MPEKNKPPKLREVVILLLISLAVITAAFLLSPTNSHYNPENKNSAHKTYSDTDIVLSIPDNSPPLIPSTNPYTEAEKEDYVASRSDLAAQWSTAHYTFVGLVVGVIGVILIVLTYYQSRQAAYFTEQALDETKLNSRRELRAYLKVEVDILNVFNSIKHIEREPVQFCVGIENCGSTPAKNVDVSIRVFRVAETYLYKQSWTQYGEGSDGFLISPNQEVLLDYKTENSLLGNTLRAKLKKNPSSSIDEADVVMAKISVSFSDIFENRHIQKSLFGIHYSAIEKAPKTNPKKDARGRIRGRESNFQYVPKAEMLLMTSEEETQENQEAS